jgi:AcrR family transcriptional regulator
MAGAGKRSRSAADWEQAALTAIAGGGLASVAIPDLARSLGVTKGSFYWHFRGIGDLVAAAIARWEAMDRAGADHIRQIANPRSRLKALFAQATESSETNRLFIALAGSSEPVAVTTLRRISEQWRRLLTHTYVEIGFSKTEARDQALLAFCTYVGAMHMRQPKDTAAFVAHALKTMIPGRR